MSRLPCWLVGLLVLVLTLASGLATSLAGAEGAAGDRAARERQDFQGNPLPPGAIARLGIARFWHPGDCTLLAFAAKSPVLASAGAATLCVWNATTGEQLRKIHIPKEDVRAVALSADGDLLAAGTNTGLVHVWDVRTGRKLLDLRGNGRGAISAVAFSPEGKTVAGSLGREIYLWDVASGELRRVVRGHRAEVCSVVFANSAKVVSAGRDGTVHTWWVGRGVQQVDVSSAAREPKSIVLSPDGEWVTAVVPGGLCVRLTAPNEYADVFPRPTQGTPVAYERVAISLSGRAVAGLSDQGMDLWEVGTGRRMQLRAGPGIRAFAFAGDGTMLATCGRGGRIRLWEVSTGQEKGLPRDREGSERLAFSPDGRILAVGTPSKVNLWDWRRLKKVYTIPARHAVGSPVAYSPDGKFLAFGRDEDIVLWDVRKGKEVLNVPTNSFRLPQVHFSRDGRRLAWGEESGKIHVWDLRSFREVRELPWSGKAGQAGSLALSPDGQIVASGGYDRFITLWDVNTGKPAVRIPTPVAPKRRPFTGGLAFSRDGKVLFSVHGLATVYCWDVASGKAVQTRNIVGQNFPLFPDDRLCAGFGVD